MKKLQKKKAKVAIIRRKDRDDEEPLNQADPLSRLDVKLGEEVGYQFRDENFSGPIFGDLFYTPPTVPSCKS